jgi:hypothetical protein
VFIFISITVFGLKIFREHLTETFYLSVLGILALMSGALMVNIMFNLTRIAEKHNNDAVSTSETSHKKLVVSFIVSFPLLFVILLCGNYLTSAKKEKMLIASARSIIENDSIKTNRLVNYLFDREWINETSHVLDFFSKTDTHFPNVSVIVLDTLDNSQVFLSFSTRQYSYYVTKEVVNGVIIDTIPPTKKNFIRQTTKEERDYLNDIFVNKKEYIQYNARDGRYELFYPCFRNGKIIVFYFSDYQRYGKIGS